jgi:hypothetical protein
VNCIQGFGGEGETEGKRSLGKPRRRWWVNIKQILNKYEGMAWTGLL